MRIAIGADHKGYQLKERLVEYLADEDYEVVDVGPDELDPEDDYPIFAAAVGRLVSTGQADRGIVICDSGIGVNVVANKFRGVRSALVNDEDLARLTRLHNDTNVLALGSMFVSDDQAERIVSVWLETDFSGEARHLRRLAEIEEIERDVEAERRQ